jgi:hypothetical protein
MKVVTTDLVYLYRRRKPGLGIVLDTKKPKDHIRPGLIEDIEELKETLLRKNEALYRTFEEEMPNYAALGSRRYTIAGNLRDYFVISSGLPRNLAFEIMMNNGTYSLSWWSDSLGKHLKKDYALVYWYQSPSCYTAESIRDKQVWYPSSWLRKQC